MPSVPFHPSRLISALLMLVVVILAGCGAPKANGDVPAEPLLQIDGMIGTTDAPVSANVNVDNLPSGIRRVEWDLDFRGVDPGELTITPAKDSTAVVESAGNSLFHFTVESDNDLTTGTIASITLEARKLPVARRGLRIHNAAFISAGGEVVSPVVEAPAIAISYISDPVKLFAFLSGIVAFVYLLAQMKAFKKFFTYFPPLIWMYFVPMFMTTLGVTPDASPLYSPFFSRILLPAVLVLLLIPSDIAGIRKLGGKALFMMLIATAGIVTGAICSFWFFDTLFPNSLPEGTWKGIAALSGSWIGGSPNMFAVIETLSTPASIIGPMVIVDTVCAYTWLGLLIALVPYQEKVDKRHRADTRAIEEMSARLSMEQQSNARAPRTADIAFMIGGAFVVSQVCLWIGSEFVFPLFNDVLKWHWLTDFMNAFGWGILVITAAGLLLSMTRMRTLDYCGASSLGNIGLYLMLTGYGAQANLRAIMEVPVFFGIGVMWILIHVCFLYAGIRLLRAPLFLASTSSMANIGGTASAPVVAAAYNQSMAPVGLLMAILGSILGTPLAIFVVGAICKVISGE